MNTSVLGAVFRRNFVAYFNSVTGYVFIFLFMLLSAYAAYWPPEFFNSNLANLGQLNLWFPIIMLMFAPAITMGIWADERRQGTDELLLTIPANDFDVVLGKYLAAVGIYSVALVLSCITNFWMLRSMGEPDVGLFLANYLGYWFVGLAMLATGMVGSFLTGNLTIAYVFGVLLNWQFVGGAYAETYNADSALAAIIKRWSIAGRFEDFGRGVVSVSSVVYFLAITAIMLYVAMMLIGRRHWLGGRDGSAMIGHYLGRGLAIVAAAVALVFIFSNYDARSDFTSAKLNQLSPETRALLANLHKEEVDKLKERRAKIEKELSAKKSAAKNDEAAKKEVAKIEQRLRQVDLDETRLKQPVQIDAFLSLKMPELYAAKRLDVIAKLREMESLAKGGIEFNIHNIDATSQMAREAKDRHGIVPRQVNAGTRGEMAADKIFLGASVRSGLNEVVIPFFEPSVPVEYELIQAIVTVSESKRKTLGIVSTDSAIMGDPFTGSRPRAIVGELKKHYNVVSVSPTEKIVDESDADKEKYDALVVVQPSSLTAPQMANLLDAIKAGVPTALFEDPFPVFMDGTPGTDQPKRPKNEMMAMFSRQAPEEKGDVRQLWELIGASMAAETFPAEGASEEEGMLAALRGDSAKETVIVWQRYNPYPSLRFNENLTSQWVFVGDKAPEASDAFGDDPISSGLTEILMLFPGAVVPNPSRVWSADEFERKLADAMKSIPAVNVVDAGKDKASKWTCGSDNGTIETDGDDWKIVTGAGEEKVETRVERKTAPAAGTAVARALAMRTLPKRPQYTPLATTGLRTGHIRFQHAMTNVRNETPFLMRDEEKPTSRAYHMAARIKGPSVERPPQFLGAKVPGEKPKTHDINVVLVADVDMMHDWFFSDRGSSQQVMRVQNVPFMLNVIDALVGDERFLEIRKERQQYGRLTKVEERIDSEVTEKMDKKLGEAEETFRKVSADNKKEVDNLKKTVNAGLEEKRKQGTLNAAAVKEAEDKANIVLNQKQLASIRKIADATLDLEREREIVQEDSKRETFALNDRYKRRALIFPVLLPLAVGAIVFVYRRSREKEGVAQSRLR